MVAGLLLDVLLPSTDRAVTVQWVVMALFWMVVLWLSRKLSKDYRLLLYGLATVNAAWFAVRAIH